MLINNEENIKSILQIFTKRYVIEEQGTLMMMNKQLY